MATSFSCFRPSPFLYPATPNPGKPNLGRRNPPLPASSNSWWTPLFGWSSDLDYIHNITTDGSVVEGSDAPESGTAKESRSRFSLGCFTEEKAKQLRMKTLESANFHDIMYHSAIASRLASKISPDR